MTMLHCIFIAIFTLFIAFQNIIPMAMEKKANFLCFILFIVYLYCWYKVLKNFRIEKNISLLKFSAIFWFVVPLFHILLIIWQLYGVHFPLFSPLILLVYSLFWGISFLSKQYFFLLSFGVCLFYFCISLNQFKKIIP